LPLQAASDMAARIVALSRRVRLIICSSILMYVMSDTHIVCLSADQCAGRQRRQQQQTPLTRSRGSTEGSAHHDLRITTCASHGGHRGNTARHGRTDQPRHEWKLRSWRGTASPHAVPNAFLMSVAAWTVASRAESSATSAPSVRCAVRDANLAMCRTLRGSAPPCDGSSLLHVVTVIAPPET